MEHDRPGGGLMVHSLLGRSVSSGRGREVKVSHDATGNSRIEEREV